MIGEDPDKVSEDGEKVSPDGAPLYDSDTTELNPPWAWKASTNVVAAPVTSVREEGKGALMVRGGDRERGRGRLRRRISRTSSATATAGVPPRAWPW